VKTFFFVLALVLTSARAETAAAATTPPAEKKPPTVILPPFEVNDVPQLSFGFSIRVMRNQATMHALGMYVERVGTGTDAERKGLKASSEILSINGKLVSEYEATFNPGSELARIFIGRKEGASVTLQVMPLTKRKPQTLTIVRRTISDEFHYKNKIGGLPSD